MQSMCRASQSYHSSSRPVLNPLWLAARRTGWCRFQTANLAPQTADGPTGCDVSCHNNRSGKPHQAQGQIKPRALQPFSTSPSPTWRHQKVGMSFQWRLRGRELRLHVTELILHITRLLFFLNSDFSRHKILLSPSLFLCVCNPVLKGCHWFTIWY